MASKKSATTATQEKQLSPVPGKPQGNASNGLNHEQIARRAYEIYLARGGEHGRHEDDWNQAERELRLGRQ